VIHLVFLTENLSKPRETRPGNRLGRRRVRKGKREEDFLFRRQKDSRNRSEVVEDEEESRKSGSSGTPKRPRKGQERSPLPQALKRQRKAEGVVANASFRYEHPLEYPDAILDLPTPLAIRYLIAHAPSQLVEGSRFRADVHMGPGVVLDLHTRTILSLGLRFCLLVAKTPSLIEMHMSISVNACDGDCSF
jgi:hypothetical protein